MSNTAITTIDTSMLNREVQAGGSSEPSILDTIHRVYIYNPNYAKGDQMDPLKE
jgi:hypothetical protein